MGTMDRAGEYRRNAEEAETRAAQVSSPLDREAHERIAKTWRELEADARRGEKRGF